MSTLKYIQSEIEQLGFSTSTLENGVNNFSKQYEYTGKPLDILKPHISYIVYIDDKYISKEDGVSHSATEHIQLSPARQADALENKNDLDRMQHIKRFDVCLFCPTKADDPLTRTHPVAYLRWEKQVEEQNKYLRIERSDSIEELLKKPSSEISEHFVGNVVYFLYQVRRWTKKFSDGKLIE